MAPPVVRPVTLVRLTVVDVPAWNSSAQRNEGPELVPRWTLGEEDAGFRELLARVAPMAKVNDSWTLEAFLRDGPSVERRPEAPTPTGASPAHTDVLVTLSDGRRLRVGEHPLYSVSAPFSDLVALTRKAGRHDVFDLKSDSP